ncbi:MAG: YifB family Mg chelatase-like AAA ATPase [Lachnospiraceae bacterium]|nr:YifB family Mg chelatase-like AAA ATPase [Lachnospiraceae bacterium]MEE0686221.1 YifB family Mg chelatase-like AAA ATPase [Lachnospiraceae bacterium]MEE0862212.1 YifB family Mg chelatase-like AAA ATPase [Lachnospiraceae bacterium]
MYSKVYSAAIQGIAMEIVAVETDVSDGLPSFEMVGLLNSEVKEARERVRSAIKNTGYLLPPKRITVNLSPADIRKEGSSFDLPIAVSILTSLGLVNKKNGGDDKILIAGELSLSGEILPMNGVLPMVLAAREKGIRKFIVPKINAKEGAVVDDVEIYGMSSLRDVISFMNGSEYEKEPYVDFYTMYDNGEEKDGELDFSDISGQESVKRAAKIAVAGMHHMLLIGTPGSGKSMIAKRIPGILPKPDMEECMEITKIHSIAGELKGTSIKLKRPFRSPHHSVTDKALIGGGTNPKPGEITLAHRGVLFLDELAEFRRETIDSLRQPLETGEVIINRLNGTYVFPAAIMLVAATNPCKCGYYPDRNRCSCSEVQVKNYLGKISGPILDRIDISVITPTVMVDDLSKKTGETSEEIRVAIEKVRKIQEDRFFEEKFRFNSEIPPAKLDVYCKMTDKAKNVMNRAYKAYGLSVRSYHKLIRVARTIADLDDAYYIEEKHIAEALGYRTELF